MIVYILRRLLYMIPILLGVNLLTFSLFFMVNTPDDMARMHLGMKRLDQQAIERWKESHGYNQPLFINHEASGTKQLTQTLFFQKSLKLFVFDFGSSDSGRDIGADIKEQMWPSLAIAVPILIIGLLVNVTFALLMVFFKGTYIERYGTALCVLLMSISSLFYIISGQYLIAKVMKLVPLSGYGNGLSAIKFVILPVLIGVLSGLGSGARWYKTIFLEERNKDYVRTARSKGLSDMRIFMVHILKNGMIPILTGVVVILPTLFLGSLLLESFFGVPGLGSYTIDAINQQDFAIVRSIVFLGSVLYIVGLMLTDISYTWVDPRIRLG